MKSPPLSLGVQNPLHRSNAKSEKLFTFFFFLLLSEAKPVAPKPQSASRGIEYTDLPNSNMRRTIAKRLSESKANIPHTYASTNCVMDSLIQFRKGLSVKVSMNDFIIKAAAISLKQVPEMNVVWNGKEAELSGQVDISVAVATDAGLITPIVKTADSLAVAEISSTLKVKG